MSEIRWKHNGFLGFNLLITHVRGYDATTGECVADIRALPVGWWVKHRHGRNETLLNEFDSLESAKAFCEAPAQ